MQDDRTITRQYPADFDPLAVHVEVDAPSSSEAPTLRRPAAGAEPEGAGEWLSDQDVVEEGGAA